MGHERAVELSAGLRWSISPGASLAWFAGALIPSFEDPAVADDPALGSYAMLEVNF